MSGRLKIRTLFFRLLLYLGTVFGISLLGMGLIHLNIQANNKKLSEIHYPKKYILQKLKDNLDEEMGSITIKLSSNSLSFARRNLNKLQANVLDLSNDLKKYSQSSNEERKVDKILESFDKLSWVEWKIVDIIAAGGLHSQVAASSRGLSIQYKRLRANIKYLLLNTSGADHLLLIQLNETASNLRYSSAVYINGGKDSISSINVLRKKLIAQAKKINSVLSSEVGLIKLVKKYDKILSENLSLKQSRVHKGVAYEIKNSFIPLGREIKVNLEKMIDDNNQVINKYQHEINQSLLYLSVISATFLVIFIILCFIFMRLIRAQILKPIEMLTDKMIKSSRRKNIAIDFSGQLLYEFHKLFHIFSNMILQRKKYEEKLVENNLMLENLSNYDQDTGLSNYMHFKDMFKEISSVIDRDNESILLAYIRMTNFDKISSFMGESKVNDTIIDFSKNLKNAIKNKALFAKIADSKFLIAMTIENSLDANKIVAEVSTCIQGCVDATKFKGLLNLAVGFVLFPCYDYSLSRLLSFCRFASIEASGELAENYRLFDDALKTKFDRLSALENDLVGSIDRGEIYVVYQPQYQLKNDEMMGCEALLRWRHPSFGLVSPDEFIHLSEKTGFINELEKYLLETTFSDYSKWMSTGCRNIKLAINASLVEIFSGQYCEKVLKQARNNNIDTKNIEIEITESIVSLYSENLSAIVTELKANNFTIAIDDFGTGYSSLERLKLNDFDLIKIDKNFIDNIVSNKKSKQLLKSILYLASSLKIKTIAEGVETEEQAEILKALGCDYVQGFFYSKPLSSEAFYKLLSK